MVVHTSLGDDMRSIARALKKNYNYTDVINDNSIEKSSFLWIMDPKHDKICMHFFLKYRLKLLDRKAIRDNSVQKSLFL